MVETIEKELFEKYKRVRIKASITPMELDDFSGKIVKSYLICVNESFEKPLSQEGGLKEVHVTPLFGPNGTPIYPKALVKCSFCKDRRPSGKKFVRVPEETFFEVAGPSALIDSLYEFSHCKFKFKGALVEMETYKVEEVSLPKDFGEAILVKMRGPVVLRDPWHKPGEALRSRFLPSPSHLFSVNVYSIFREKYFEALKALERGLVEDHSTLHSIGKVWYLYEGKWLPALSGTALFWVRELNDVVKTVLKHAALLGVGSGRAAGFGDVEIASI
ncbi:hypothetical protein EYM_06625 [Ignicoccus islandicus DSM 13165]|uniref:Uncharacterized protein n=1 Tax=Ignicoccus islandicus DSM 13165 TaxID=940295 RepID=A0A0U3FQV4_9CREN|nr:CRISPR system precrRNA processing endoribonuclease RAMP protein Cas6 [Ignicoccus islandicus]ALU12703.1 hypothetical protein EYM_06625 [Ignicoccus islandicus DSM 13165]